MEEKNARLQALIEGIIYKLAPITNVYNVYVDENTTLAKKLSEIITSLNGKAKSEDVGDISKLTTIEKGNIVSAINEVAQKSDDTDLTGYATEQYVHEYSQPKGDYLVADKLQGAVDDALAQAKESGEFDGATGNDGTDGKSAYDYAQDAGYTGTEEEFTQKLAEEPLIAVTDDITPAQVADAVGNGRNVILTHIDGTYGAISFNNFIYVPVMGAVISSAIIYFAGKYIVMELAGSTQNGTWSAFSEVIATAEDVPESLKNPYSLTINGVSYDGSQAVNMSIQGENGDTIPEYVRIEAERVAKAVQSRQNADTITFIAASDFHYSTKIFTAAQQKESMTHMGQAMELIRKMVHVDFTVALGDMVWDSGETVDEAMAAMRFVSECLQSGTKGLRTRGNHDCLYSNSTRLTDAQIFANVGAWNSGAEYDPDNRLGGYCYRDFDDVKIRVICLNSSESNSGGCLFSTKQVTWLSDVLNLSEKGEEWRSIIVSHHPLDWGKDGGGNPITAVNSAAGVIAAFHGHTHNFKVDTVTGASIKRIAIPNACFGRENEYNTAYGITWEEDTTYSKTAGTASDTSFCVITIDRATCKIYADHYGAGYDREVDYVDTGDSGGSSYVNAVLTAEEDDSNNIYNGTGYKNGAYCSSNGGDSEDAACVATGNMAYDWLKNNPIYIKGASVTNESHVRIYGYATKGAAPHNSACCTGQNISTHFTMEELETGNYYKLTPVGDHTVVKYLRLSLIGTGENLIVSFGKPIE